MPDVHILSWDYKEQPDLDELMAIINQLSANTIHHQHIDTGSDQYAVAFSATPLDEQAAQDAYDDGYFGEDIGGEWRWREAQASADLAQEGERC